jgi:hypothetical protein
MAGDAVIMRSGRALHSNALNRIAVTIMARRLRVFSPEAEASEAAIIKGGTDFALNSAKDGSARKLAEALAGCSRLDSESRPPCIFGVAARLSPVL